jgi:hypothetical protein
VAEEEECVFEEGVKKQIHVHQQRIRKGLPALIVRIGGQSRSEYFHDVSVEGPCVVIQPGRQLSCGAKVWIETESRVVATRLTSEEE